MSNSIRLKKPLGFWTKERCIEEALKYKTRSEFHKLSQGAYDSAKKNGWLEVFSHMTEIKKPKGYWSKEKCAEEVLKYKTSQELRDKNFSLYIKILENGWDEICSHLKITRQEVNSYWTKEKCIEEASLYKTKTEFITKAKTAYTISLRNGWLDSICSRMNSDMDTLRYEKCRAEALKYNSKTEFAINSNSAYKISRKNGWLNDICSHMIKPEKLAKPEKLVKSEKLAKPKKSKKVYDDNYDNYDYDYCKKVASKYKNVKDFKYHAYSVYLTSRNKKWLNDFFNN